MSGKVDDVKGRIKEAMGDLTNDPNLKREGKIDRAAGKMKEKAEKTVDRIKKAVKH